jgi:hypothetical protein
MKGHKFEARILAVLDACASDGFKGGNKKL